MQRLVLFYIREDTDLTRTIAVAGWTMNDFIPIMIDYSKEVRPRYDHAFHEFHEFCNKSRCGVKEIKDKELRISKIKELLDDYFPKMLGRNITPSSVKKFISKTWIYKVQHQLNSATSSTATHTTNAQAVRL